jgi:RNA polymerase sigma factor (sigma-70 family)
MNNADFEQYLNAYTGFIIYHAKLFGIYRLMERDDILQEGYLVLWEAFNSFNGSGSFSAFFHMKLRSRFITIWKNNNRKKHQGPKFISLDSKAWVDGNLTIYDIIQAPGSDFEEVYFNDFVERILKDGDFTQLEREVLTGIINQRTYGQYYRVYTKLEDALNIKHKTIDNALYRIRKKIKKHPSFSEIAT